MTEIEPEDILELDDPLIAPTSGSYTSGVEKELDDLGIMSDEDDFEDPAFLFDDDYQLLRFGYGWRGISHDASQPQMHRISVAKSDCKRSDFVHLLKKIGCEERFVACSIESPHAFFAELTEDEAAELEDLFPIFVNPPYRYSKMGNGK